MSYASRIIVSSLLALSVTGAVRAEETPLLGKKEVESFRGEAETLKLLAKIVKAEPLTLPNTYKNEKWNVRVSYGKEWSTTEEVKTSTKLETYINPWKASPWFTIRTRKMPKQLTVADIDPFFDRISQLNGGTMLSDWFIPSLGYLERSDSELGGHAGREFVFASNRGDMYIGIMRMTVIGDTLYSWEMFVPYKDAPKAYVYFEAMTKTFSFLEHKTTNGAASSKSSSPTRSAQGKQASSRSSASSKKSSAITQPIRSPRPGLINKSSSRSTSSASRRSTASVKK